MDWVASVIWWHSYPLRFVGAEARADELPEGQVEHRLGRITGWLDYLIELGANGLMLAPVFASTSHGYDTLDYFRVDPRLGDLDDLRELGVDDFPALAKEPTPLCVPHLDVAATEFGKDIGGHLARLVSVPRRGHVLRPPPHPGKRESCRGRLQQRERG